MALTSTEECSTSRSKMGEKKGFSFAYKFACRGWFCKTGRPRGVWYSLQLETDWTRLNV